MSTVRSPGIETVTDDGFRKIVTLETVQRDTGAILRVTRRGRGQRWSEYAILSRAQLVTLREQCSDTLALMTEEVA